jgi:hypothetical protein
MSTITVDTALDVVDANDGKTSLREALVAAATAGQHVDIAFKEDVFYNAANFQTTAITLDKTLTVADGTDVTIDGSLFIGGNFYGLKLLGDQLDANILTVAAGAKVTLRDVTLKGSANGQHQIQAHYGTDGHAGADGVNGQGIPDGALIHQGTGVSGGHATDGSDAPNDAEDGRMAVGAIINYGDLTLERVDITSFRVAGGNGGIGGDGGRGGKGGNGDDATGPDMIGPAGSGGNGGNSADGAKGGNGGDAIAGIYNSGNLVLRDTTFSAMTARGGNGGSGGDGGDGGHGGYYGYSELDLTARGGDGGNGGNGADGGRGGLAAAALWNVGIVTWNGVQSNVAGTLLTAGTGGPAGDFGYAGVHGGARYSSWTSPYDGLDGQEGLPGHAGAGGGTGNFLGASVTTGISFIVDTARAVISEDGDTHERTVYFSIRMLGGDGTGTHKVDWSFSGGPGVTAADFEGGALPAGGTMDFSDGSNNKFFGYVLAADGVAEGTESFTITLSNPFGGQLGWSKSVTVQITDTAGGPGTPTDHAPTAVTLSRNSIAENSAKNTLIGSLSTTDADSGDHFTYKLLDSAGGRFMLSGNTIRVANGVLLDYEQHKSHVVTVRSTDSTGHILDKKLTINVADVRGETAKGDALANVLKGGIGNDKLYGKGGNDTLTGGSGADSFFFDTKLNKSTNVDKITDFSHSQHDLFKLDNAIFAKLGHTGALNSAYFRVGTKAVDANDYIVYDRAHGKLYYDADGSHTAYGLVQFAVLPNHPALTAGDFVVI